MRKLLLILSILLLSACLSATYADDTIVHIQQYADTFKLQDASATVSISDDLLLDLVAQQGRLLADSLSQNDSTTLSTEEAEQAMAAMRERLRQEAIVADSIRIDSIRQQTQLLAQQVGYQGEIQDIRIEKHIFRDEAEDRADIQRAIRQEYSPWYKEARTLAQFTQNYISPNWYKGGNSSLALLSILKGTIKYKNNNFVWENTGEWRIGISTTGKSDTIHHVNITDDLFKLYSKAGYQFYSQLYAMGYVDFQTTLLPSWKTNSNQLQSAFMTPVRFNVGVGIDYKPLDWLTINFSPGTFKLVHATINDSARVNVTEFGIDANQKTLTEFGSSVRIEAKYKPLREIQLYTLLYLYTNYHQVEFDWQIECDFIINRFLSTHLSLHPRFDSTVKSAEPQHMQFKELLSIGFNHYFH